VSGGVSPLSIHGAAVRAMALGNPVEAANLSVALANALRQMIPLDRVREAYDSAALTVSRIRSEEQDDNEGDDLDLLPYYEGKRDALKALLEPPNDQVTEEAF